MSFFTYTLKFQAPPLTEEHVVPTATIRLLRDIDEDCPLDDYSHAEYVPDWPCGRALYELSSTHPGLLFLLYVFDHDANEGDNQSLEYWRNGERRVVTPELIYPEPIWEAWQPYITEEEENGK